jgi:hypothetical protein
MGHEPLDAEAAGVHACAGGWRRSRLTGVQWGRCRPPLSLYALKIAKIVSEVNCVLWYNALISDFCNFGELLPHGSYWQVECRIRGIGTFLSTQLQ